MSRIIVSSIGAVSSAGNSLKENLESLKLGKIAPTFEGLNQDGINDIYPVFKVNTSEENFSKNNQRDRTYFLLSLALNEALSTFDLEGKKKSGKRIGVFVGTTVASQLNDIEFYRKHKESSEIDLESFRQYLDNNLAQRIKNKFELDGPAFVISNACSSSLDAIGTGYKFLKSKICDIAICAGADELNNVPITGFSVLGLRSKEICRPFDKNRNGLNLGEGAGVMILEAVEDDTAKGNKVEICSYSSYADAYHLTAPSTEGIGLRSAIYNCLNESNLKPKEISFINAHGTATKDNDLTEGKVYKEIFGKNLKFLSTKGYIGHTLGAAGVLEAIFTAENLRQGWAPYSAGFEEVDSEIGISPICKNSEIVGNKAMSVSLAFGGNNSCIIFSKR